METGFYQISNLHILSSVMLKKKFRMIKNASKAKTWAPSKIYTVGHFGLLQSFGIFEGFTGQHNKELEQKIENH